MNLSPREEAKKKGVRAYNDGEPCSKGHFPAVRLTSTGQCILCNKELAIENNEKKRIAHEKKLVLDNIKKTTTCYFWFTYMDGSQQLFGPYKTAKGAATALCNLWLKTYGYPHPDLIPSDFDYSKN